MTLPSIPIEPCLAPTWAKDGHSQTLLGHFMRSPVLKTSGQLIQIPLKDGDILEAAFYQGESPFVVYLFHGLGGSIQADYMQRTALVSLKQGHSVLLVNHRGASPNWSLAKKLYNSGSWPDMSEAIQFGREAFPNKKHIAIGFSLSGNALLSLLAHPAYTQPDFAISVNSPILLEDTSVRLSQGLNRIYDFRFVFQFRQELKERTRRGFLKKKYSIPFRSTLYEFDEIFTAPEGGYQNRKEYYDLCSSFHKLSQIQTPHVILTSEDDPFVAIENYRKAKLSPSSYLHIEKIGGHMGYISSKKTPLKTSRWLDYALNQFLIRFTSI